MVSADLAAIITDVNIDIMAKTHVYVVDGPFLGLLKQQYSWTRVLNCISFLVLSIIR